MFLTQAEQAIHENRFDELLENKLNVYRERAEKGKGARKKDNVIAFAS